MEDKNLTTSEVKRRVARSFVSLTGRQIALRAISFISINIILAKVLPVSTLGIFNIATSIITFFAFFSDIGLAASLIQKKGEVTRDDIRTTFTIQLMLVALLSIVIVLGAPFFGDLYQLDESGVFLIRILGLSFFLTSLKVVPSVLLERQLNFNPLVLVEIIETVVFNGLLIFLVMQGHGIWSFSIAALVRGVIGVVLIYSIAPVKIGLGIERQAAKGLLSFGVPFQINNLLALLKDRLVPLVIAGMIGAQGIGYVTWAQGLAFLPLEAMNIVLRITFPAYSRLQHDTQALGRAIEKSLFVTSAVVYPLIFGIGALLPALVTYVVSVKWEPAVLSFYLFAFSTFWAVLSTTFTNALNATGHIKTTLKLMIMWTVLTWVLTPLLVLNFGFTGVAGASFLISFTSIVTVVLFKRVVKVEVIRSIYLPVVSSSVMATVVYLFSILLVRDRLMLVLAIILGGLVYSGMMFLLGKDKISSEIKSLIKLKSS